jgi:ketosteroid isomerase-like protein
MTDSPGRALETALAYFRAWTSKDVERAMTYIAPDIVCEAPAGRLEGAEAYRGFMGPFVEILLDAELLGAFGDDETAMVMYDTRTLPVASAPGAELVKVRDGRIVHSWFLFDRLPFEQARRTAG